MKRIINLTSILSLAVAFTFAACFSNKGKGDQVLGELQKAFVAFIAKIDPTHNAHLDSFTKMKENVEEHIKALNEAKGEEALKEKATQAYTSIDSIYLTINISIKGSGVTTNAPESQKLETELKKSRAELQKIKDKVIASSQIK